MEFNIISMTLEDVDEVAEVEKECFYTAWTKEDFVKEMTENELAVYVVAKSEGKIIGYAGMWHIVDEGHITNIAVLPEYRRYGVGSSLVQKLLDISEERNIVGLTLEVRIGNTIAQKLYSKYGFKAEGIRKRYYSDTGEDAVIMWKR